MKQLYSITYINIINISKTLIPNFINNNDNEYYLKSKCVTFILYFLQYNIMLKFVIILYFKL